MSKINAHPDHLRQSGGKLGAVGGKLADGGEKLQTAGQNLVSHASGDRPGIGAVVAKERSAHDPAIPPPRGRGLRRRLGVAC